MLDVKALLAKITDSLICDLLYNSSFTTGTASLTKSIANYNSLIFVYTDNDGVKNTKRIVTNKSSSVNGILDVVRVTGAVYVKTMVFNINGQTLTASYNRQWASNTPTQGSYVTLKKVYGCHSIGGGVQLKGIFSAFMARKAVEAC